MNVTTQKIDNLNLNLIVEIKKDDYQPQVDKTLKQYRKTADIPGFRKGHVPMNMLKKQYEASIKFDEINKLVQKGITEHIEAEKLNVLGYPIPKDDNTIDVKAEDHSLEFEVGVYEDFEVNYSNKNKITKYVIEVSDKEVDDTVLNHQRRFGEFKDVEEATEEGHMITLGVEAIEVEGYAREAKPAYLKFEDISPKFLKKNKITQGATIEAKISDLLKEKEFYSTFLGATDVDIEIGDIIVKANVDKISVNILHEVNEDLFKKVFSEKEIKDEKAFKEEIKTELASFYEQMSDQKLFGASLETLIEENEIVLPEEFLLKWIKTSGEKELSEEEAKTNMEQSIKGLKYQLIENKIVQNEGIKITQEEILDKARQTVEAQFKQYGMDIKLEQDQLDEYAKSTLQREEDYKKMTDQILGEKIYNILKEKMSYKDKKLSLDDFQKLE